MDFGVHTSMHRVSENILFEEVHRGVVIFICFDDQLRQPMRMFMHPSDGSGSERWIAFFGARIFDFLLIERLRQPFCATNLSHADIAPSFSDSSAKTPSRFCNSCSRAHSAAAVSMRIPRRRISRTIGSRSHSSR